MASMKKIHPLLLLTLLLTSVTCPAQNTSDVVDLKKHKIVIQYNDADTVSQLRMVQQVGNIRASWPNASVEVVCHGGGIELLMKSKSKASKAIADWTSKGVVFAACNNTMRIRNLSKEDLLLQSVVVPSAIIELTLKQEKGWAYFKGGPR
jgi:intracellular sulfur oxidation DsrE/DsrF family protein